MTTAVAGLLVAPPADRLPAPDLDHLVAEVERAGLVGRGGAGFPTAVKLRSVAGAAGLTVVGNAMEGEPLSRKDAVLIDRSPHLVVEGLVVVATALGATRRMVGVGRHLPAGHLLAAAAPYDVEVLSVGGGFVAGQESALARGLSGGVAVPTDRLRRVSERGVDGRPTLVLNVETLAQVARLVRFGAAATDSSLFTLSGALGTPGVVEARRGSTVREVVDRGAPSSLQAVLLGGYHGTWLPAAVLDAPLTPEGLAPWGASVGAGVVHVLPTGACPLGAAADIARHLAAETAGQCGPCVNALPRVADTLARLAARAPDPRLPDEVRRLCALAAGRGACAHPDGTVRMVLSALRAFGADVEAHLQGRCVA